MAAKKKARKATKAAASKGSRKKVKRPSRKTSAAPTRKPSRKKKTKKLTKVEKLERYVRSLERQLSKYKKQRFQGPLKPGEKRRKPPKTELEAVRSKLKLFLEGAKRQLEATNIAANYRSFENADYSIDAELRVPIEENGMVDSILIDVEEAANWNSLGEFWISLGYIVGAEEVTGSPTIDKRPHSAWSNFVRGNRAGAAFFTSREYIAKNLESYGGDISKLIVAITWHPDNLRPNRRRR